MRKLEADESKTVNEASTSLGNRPAMILTMYAANRGEIFKTYKSLVSFIATEIKGTIVSIGQNIKICESIIKIKKEERWLKLRTVKFRDYLSVKNSKYTLS